MTRICRTRANLDCFKSYQDWVVRSAEVMVPCPGYPEVAEMLADSWFASYPQITNWCDFTNIC